ncbi:alpha/beta fold hydrolase [Amycolatopsis jiangsuensis]|uniref:Pimeloyl-ACP methyl ester carboxylesterase n=1 Tax=Amycolatopsis jiangsuensis TaxID=1181879 RepID=A0A840IVF6_9PSEU|nr:alpha/beta hydrolase [Amycolatopsis jiangsuensis]MBB4685860.1 pimeloyl-ACP methyl ester carboxylesterase [Amycolatopsis jiangsuensis]
MPAVFVNGNPESAAVWDPLCAELDRADVLRLSPPGFGAPVPDGFGGTVTDYRDWLVEELTALGEPVDLVGHDIGGSTALSVAMTRPDLLRTWVSDSLGVFHPDYVWHDLARLWQTPGAGEESVAGLLGGSLEQRTARMVSRGIPEPVAERLAAAQGPEMGQAILTLYRSMVQPVMAELGRNLPAAAARPGLAMLATEDQFGGPPDRRREAATQAGARVAVLEGLGHWWMAQDPARGARMLTAFWAEPVSTRPL